MRIFIHANNVHQGGGRSLLLSLLKAINEKRDWFANLDARLKLDNVLINEDRLQRVPNTLLQRLISEWRLARKIKKGDLLFCFGNLPPLFRSKGKVFVFLQNRYLIEKIDLSEFPQLKRIRIHMERFWFNSKAKNVDLFIVQTPTMKRILDDKLSGMVSTVTLPFMSIKVESAENKLAIESSKPNRFDFLYVASGEPHKNHRNLVDGWCKLAEAGHFPSLCITVDDYIFPDLCSWIDERIAFYGLKIINLGNIPACDVKLLYRQVGALIFPSKFESLGLPLIEARQARLPIIAPEVDYVRDILDPVEAFDPGSPISIARAVRRFLGDRESPLSVLHTDEFINTIIFLAENAL